MRRRSTPGGRWWLVLTLLIVALTGCGGAGPGGDTPPEIVYGEDLCDECGMIISDERFAAGLVVELEPGVAEHRIFDDIGGMLLYERAHGDEFAISHIFVHDYASREWIDGESAFYVWSDAIRSPMGHGIAASRDRTGAETLAREWGGRVVSLDVLRVEFDVDGGADHEHP